ncbi:hypothetical protein PRIPAC_76965, partial [Pristionchus pacificus]
FQKNMLLRVFAIIALLSITRADDFSTTTEVPFSTTDAAENVFSTTEAPLSTADNEFTTVESHSTTEKPLTTTEEELTTTEKSLTTTGIDFSTTAADENSFSTTEESLATTEKLLTTTEEPLTTTEKLLSTTEESQSTTEEQFSTTEKPLTTTAEQLTTTEKSHTTTEEVLTTTEKPLTTTAQLTTTEEPLTTAQEVFSTAAPLANPCAGRQQTGCDDVITSCPLVFVPGADGSPSQKCFDTEDGDYSMTPFCRKTCKLCCKEPKFDCDDAPISGVTCPNTQENCNAFGDLSFEHCRSSCGWCALDAKPCVDLITTCANLKAAGLCSEQEVSSQCEKTCHLCKVPGCDDSTERCDVWARNGFCDDPFYTADKGDYCQRSCDMC